MSQPSAHFRWMTLILACLTGSLLAQSQTSQISSVSAVPAMVKFSGTVPGAPGRLVGLTFALYKDQSGGAPLWLETQSVPVDGAGHYTVQLGATLPNGLPKELFASGEARWLGVQREGQAEQSRVLLLSVPYALKAADAETLGGLPLSAFVLATPSNATPAAASAGSATGSASAPPPNAAVTGLGTVNFVPLWDTTTDIVNSAISQTGSGTTAKIGINTAAPTVTLDVKGAGTIRGALTLPTTGPATATTGKNSQPLNLSGSAFNSGTSAAVNQTFRLQTEPVGNNSATPGGKLNLLYYSGSNAAAETGLSIASNGTITFADGQTFPGAGTITGVSAGAGLTGGGTAGTVTLNLDPTIVPQLNAVNTFTGNQTVNGNLTATGTVTGSSFQIGSALFAYGSYADANAFLGFGGSTANTGDQNTAIGKQSLFSNTTGSQNTALGYFALPGNSSGNANTALGAIALNDNTTGYNNTASGVAAMQGNTTGAFNTADGLDSLALNTTGTFNTAIGFLSGPDAAHTGLSNSTAVGAFATVTANNSVVLGSIAGVNGAGSSANVGIGTTAPAYSLDVHGTGNFTGPVTFTASQTFPNTISGVTVGAGLTGGGTTGNVTLNLDTAKVPLLNVANTFVGNQGVTGNLNATGNLNTSGNLTANGSINAGSGVLNNGGPVILRVNQLSLAANTFGILAQTAGPSSIAVYGQSNDSNGIGVEGLNNSATGGVGLFGAVNNSSGVGIGVWGKTGSSTGSSIGVEADAFSPTGIGLFATNPAGGLAAKFAGPVQVMGDFAGTGNVTGTTVNATSSYTLGSSLFAFGEASSYNVFLGFAGSGSLPGTFDTAVGALALASSSAGSYNTAVGGNALRSNVGGAHNVAGGSFALYSNQSGSYNTAVGESSLWSNLGSSNTALGYNAGQPTSNFTTSGSSNTFVGASTTPGTQLALSNASAIGANAEVDINNAMVLGSINGVNGATANTNVGIGTTSPVYKLHIGIGGNGFRVEGPSTSGTGLPAGSFGGNGDFGIDAPGIVAGRFVVKEGGLVGVGVATPVHIFQVGQGKGAAFADSWSTYSSRRWKTNIRTLPDALAKVEQLRGVSYDLKGSGKHEIGVIAEEVGQVVPEVVSFEENGTDAQGVDYSRLTAVLIEAIKEQQRQIADQQQQIRLQQRQIVRLNGKVELLESGLRTTKQNKAAATGRLLRSAASQAGIADRPASRAETSTDSRSGSAALPGRGN